MICLCLAIFCYFCRTLKLSKLNYLAHIFLSGNNKEIQVGNFIADFVKGSKLNDYPIEIRKGIVLHRLIDEFTDNHLIVKETITLLRPEFGRYSGIIVDMYFDYFLAKNFNQYANNQSLSCLSLKFYFAVILYYKYLPARVKRFIFHFISTSRLTKYATVNGLKNSLEIMANHKVSALNPEQIIEFLEANLDELEQKFHLFFPELINFANLQLNSGN